jgi:hypothetical protein
MKFLQRRYAPAVQNWVREYERDLMRAALEFDGDPGVVTWSDFADSIAASPISRYYI